MAKLHDAFKTTRLFIWLIACVLILAATSVYAAGDQRPLAAVDILGSPDAAVDGQFAVGTTTLGNKTLTVAGVIDFVGAGSVHNYFTQGPGNNMQIRSNVDEYNAVGNSSYAQWNMVMGASLDVFSIRRSPASSTYNEDALFWIEGDTGKIGIATVDTSNGATIPFTLEARLHVKTDTGDAIRGTAADPSSVSFGVYGHNDSTVGRGVYGYAAATSGSTIGVFGKCDSTVGWGVFGSSSATSGLTYGVYGRSQSTEGRGVYGYEAASSGITTGVYGRSNSTAGRGVYGYTSATSGTTYGVYGESDSSSGIGVYGFAAATSGFNYGVYGESGSNGGIGIYGYASNGVWGESYTTFGYGVYGSSIPTNGTTYGVYGISSSTAGRGVHGRAEATSGTNYGVVGESDSSAGYDFYASGAGTDYGPFTGAHEVQLVDSFPVEVQAGMIVSAVGETQVRRNTDGSVDLSSTLPTVQLADRVEDGAVLGVILTEVNLPDVHWYTPQAGERFASVNALGEGRVWVTNVNGGIQAGDLITTSEIPGYGQRQNDDVLHSYTLGKATDTVDWGEVTETIVFNGQEYKVFLLGVVYTSG